MKEVQEFAQHESKAEMVFACWRNLAVDIRTRRMVTS